MRVIVLGGDGFCGWPTALHLSKHGYEVLIVDNFARRNIDNELGTQSLTPIKTLELRINKWNELTGNKIKFLNIDISCEYDKLLNVIKEYLPQVVVHFAEQRSAPYSMKSAKHKRYTVNNNLNATNNVLCAIVESGLDIHVVHLGTMGVYGYGSAGMAIPEGYLKINVSDQGMVREEEILYPAHPGSIYHMTKTQDQLLFYFYNKNDKTRITDLHQGIVWGTQTDETILDESLINRFDYDGDFGTVLNRFLVQSAVGHPLTVHGTGGQVRAFINLKDTVKCIRYAIEHPPKVGDKVDIYNQMTETHRIIALANKVSSLSGAKIELLSNPRNEATENELHVKNDKFFGHEIEPITLDDGLLSEITQIAKRYADRVDFNKIPCMSCWNKEREKEIKRAQR